MLFNSYVFFVFFAFVLALDQIVRNWKLRKTFLLLMSYVFYAAWNPPFVVLLWISTVADWILGLRISRAQSLSSKRFLLSLSLLVNLGMLAYFKYGTFILENFVYLVNQAGFQYQPAMPSIILPVGISFYTFQTLSYTFDIYKGNLKPGRSFLDYALYVTFFPQLVAGPIVRAIDFLPQCEKPKKGSLNQVGWGLSLMTVGLFNKMVIADQLMAPVVEKVFDQMNQPSFFQAWAGALAFSVQIFCDFSGYSTCAIGVAMCLGFNLPDNFRFPYSAIGFSDFWSRWHITLSGWLRDYLYISLGGNRKGKARTYINLMVTMLLGGLWHGASWLFVIWGGLHGLYLIAERLIIRFKFAAWRLWQTFAGEIILSAVTFLCIVITWVFFRAMDLDKALILIKSMIGIHTSGPKNADLYLHGAEYASVFFCTIGLLFFHRLLRHSNLENLVGRLPWWLNSFVLFSMVFCIYLSFSGEDRAFIYFQF